MAQVTLSIGGRRYEIACREGEQPRFEALADVVDAKAREAGRSVGTVNEVRQLLLASLLMADELIEARGRAGDPGAALAPAIDALAARLEALAGRLEKAPADA